MLSLRGSTNFLGKTILGHPNEQHTLRTDKCIWLKSSTMFNIIHRNMVLECPMYWVKLKCMVLKIYSSATAERLFGWSWVRFNSNTTVWWGVAGNQRHQLRFEYSPYLHPTTIHTTVFYWSTPPPSGDFKRRPWKILPTQGKGWRPRRF